MVTPRELARRLRVDPKRLRAWLRSQAAAGHPLLGGHVHNGRWEFGEEEADQLAREFIGGAPAPRQAKSSTPSTEPAGPVTDADGGPGHRVVEEWGGEELETLADLLRPGLRGLRRHQSLTGQRRGGPLLPGALRTGILAAPA